ncbi:voltage-gated potassium channel protein [Castellaniella caeni]|uniref:voltage-gated potassium channel protein n=1 Tax=Castellaniella caeni TaxID=266123 RepID=UPI000C9F6335|nr:voltage-gated potassium channel protein [Castellaniella caeni]
MRLRLSLLFARFARLMGLFPWHWLLAVLVAVDGYVFLQPLLHLIGSQGLLRVVRVGDSASVRSFLDSGGMVQILHLMLGLGVQVMAIGLLYRARIAWVMSLLLLAAVGAYSLVHGQGHLGLLIYTVVLAILLLIYWRSFDRASLTAGSLFAVLSVLSLLVYAVFGVLYLGDEFAPPIHDPITALYFSIVSMSTVGYGDIAPHTDAARLFTVSIIILGITVFATSISAVVGPLIGGNLRRLVHGRTTRIMRKNHIILAGADALAQSLYEALKKRGHEVTVIVPSLAGHPYPPEADLLEGDASETGVLEQAGAAQARYILALHQDDAENAFIVMAGREAGGPDTRLVALVNVPTHLAKIRRVSPDIVISLQALGSEILARTLSGEPVDEALITRLLFGEKAPDAASAPGDPVPAA